MFILLFLFWVILNGRFTPEIALFGLVIAAAVRLFCCRILHFSFRREREFLRKLPVLPALFGTLFREIWKANRQVAKLGYAKDKPDACLVDFEVPLRTETARAVLADCITLTPGTITGRLEGNRFTVHCLDPSFAEGLDDSAFVALLEKMEEKRTC